MSGNILDNPSHPSYILARGKIGINYDPCFSAIKR